MENKLPPLVSTDASLLRGIPHSARKAAEETAAPVDRVTVASDLQGVDPVVQGHVNKLMKVAYEADDPYRARLNREPVAQYVQNISDRPTLTGVKAVFDERLRRETMSTYRSGAMAGALCNQMRIYGAIVSCLAEKLQEKR